LSVSPYLLIKRFRAAANFSTDSMPKCAFIFTYLLTPLTEKKLLLVNSGDCLFAISLELRLNSVLK